jgi:hypothetical protein
MIWGKTAKACGTTREAWTMVFRLIRWVDLSRSLSTWRILKNMMLLLCPNRQVPPFASNSSQGSKITPTPRSAACKKPGVDSKPPQKIVFKKLGRGQGEKIRWSS